MGSLLDRLLMLRPLGHRPRVPVVRQLSANDCGAAALAMVLAFHGKRIPVEKLRAEIGAGRSGADVAAILETARRYGLRGRGIRIELEHLRNLECGTILHWAFHHYVVFERSQHKTVDIVDPAIGRRSIPLERFSRAFTGVAVILEPAEEFNQGDVEPKNARTRGVGTYPRLVAYILAATMLMGVGALALPVLIQGLIDRVMPRTNYQLLLVFALAYAAFQMFGALARFIRAQLMVRLQSQMDIATTVRYIDRLVELPYAFFAHRPVGNLIVRTGGLHSARDVVTTVPVYAAADATLTVLYLIAMIAMSIPLTLIALTVAFLRTIVMVETRRRQRELIPDALERQARSESAQEELLDGIETWKAMGAESTAAEQSVNAFVEAVNGRGVRQRLDAGVGALRNLLSGISTGALLLSGSALVMGGYVSLGTMVAFVALSGLFLESCNELATAAWQLYSRQASLDPLSAIADAAPEQDRTAVIEPGILSGAVSIQSVAFRYGNGPLVVDDMSLEVASGSRIAIVGPTGSGKSTLARLILGLHEPCAGQILFDGQDLRRMNRRSVRRQLGVVPQETRLLSGTIRTNIALSNPEMSLDAVVRAAKLACIHDDILAMPMGYQTVLANRGLALSSGQRQRLAIARAVAHRPRILLLDEAGSHLDAITEMKVHSALASLGCTVITITHRLSTVREADYIVLLDSGRIVERGRHEELLASRGAYAALVRTVVNG